MLQVPRQDNSKPPLWEVPLFSSFKEASQLHCFCMGTNRRSADQRGISPLSAQSSISNRVGMDDFASFTARCFLQADVPASHDDCRARWLVPAVAPILKVELGMFGSQCDMSLMKTISSLTR
jgi:hypothetical protein